MLRIDQIRLLPDDSEELLRDKCAKILCLPVGDVLSCRVLRRAIDAREGLTFVYTMAAEVKNEAQVLRRCRDRRVSAYRPEIYTLPSPIAPPSVRPVVVGAGPAGLFAALVLAKCGAQPILLERGQPVEQRQSDVERFWDGGALDTESNVQFGEGGAGAFSDGKLNTGTRDIRHRYIMETLVRCGVPESILTDGKPHAGTDKLHLALKNLRRELTEAGADIRFGARLESLTVQDGAVSAVTVRQGNTLYKLPARQVVLALGHSARDTFEMLYRTGLHMEQKPFAMGIRIEHRQADINAAQYRTLAGHPSLPPSSYKLSCHLPNGRSAFSFCVCPGGQVVAAASEAGHTVTNGMSAYARNGENINGALLVNVTPEDMPSVHPLAGIQLQRKVEAAAFALTGGYRAPCQRVEDFLLCRPSAAAGLVLPSYRPGVVYTDLRRCLPAFIADALTLALPLLGHKLKGYDHPDALLTGVETRSSSPVRLVRDENFEASIRGIHPCGEGAGYAGGILSAAADGMRCAEKLLEVYRK